MTTNTKYGPEEAQRDLRSEWQEKNKAAFEMISNLCRPTTDPKHRDWIMSIPARENHDPDIVIGSALRAAAAYIRELEGDVAFIVDLHSNHCALDCTAADEIEKRRKT